LIVAVLAVFGQTVYHGFIDFDDDQYVFENPHVMGFTTHGLIWAFTDTHAVNWHPLTWLSHMLDCQLYGLKPGGHHLTNVLLHAATSVLLFLVLWQMTAAMGRSAFVAAVFAIHPLRVESVAWVAERKDVLSGLFFMLTLGAYLGYARRPFSLARYGLMMLLFVLGLLSKPMLVTLPFVLLLLDYWPLGRFGAASAEFEALPIEDGQGTSPPGHPRHLSPVLLLIEKLPLLLLAAGSCVATFLAQHEVALANDELKLPARLANASVSYLAYVGKMFYPVGLAVFYPHPQNGLPAWKVTASVLAIAAILAATWLWRRKHPYLIVGWLWYLGMLVPVIGLVQVGAQAMADRYTYLPQIGLSLAVTWLTWNYCSARRSSRWLAGVTAVLVVAGLMSAAARQTSFWRDNETLWNHTLACTSQNHVAHNLLGNGLFRQGRVDEATSQYQQALEIAPNYMEGHYNLGLVFYRQGKLAEAITHFQLALAANPRTPEVYNNLGNALFQQGRLDDAFSSYQKAIEIDPEHAMAYYNLGVISSQRGDSDAAIAQYRKALQYDPRFADAYHNLAFHLERAGHLDEAIADYQQALACKPSLVESRNQLGDALFRQGKIPAAVAQWRESLRIRPEQIAVLNEMAWVLATSPDTSSRHGAEAVALAQHAVELCGGREPAILDTLAASEAESGRIAEALQTARRALALAASQHNTALADKIATRIKVYQAGTPFRDK
jgi:tetratricopeptide (TPR) repeat protein